MAEGGRQWRRNLPIGDGRGLWADNLTDADQTTPD